MIKVRIGWKLLVVVAVSLCLWYLLWTTGCWVFD